MNGGLLASRTFIVMLADKIMRKQWQLSKIYKEADNKTSDMLNHYFCSGNTISRMFHALFLSGGQEHRAV